MISVYGAFDAGIQEGHPTRAFDSSIRWRTSDGDTQSVRPEYSTKAFDKRRSNESQSMRAFSEGIREFHELFTVDDFLTGRSGALSAVQIR